MTKKIIKVDDDCYESYPCQHYVEIDNNGKIQSELMSWPDIVELAKETNFDLSNLRCYDFYNDGN